MKEVIILGRRSAAAADMAKLLKLAVIIGKRKNNKGVEIYGI